MKPLALSIIPTHWTIFYKFFAEKVGKNENLSFWKGSKGRKNNENDKKLIDGSHRIAVAVYFGLNEIPVTYDSSNRLYKYGFDWFLENDFSDIETSEIEECYKRFMGRVYSWNL